MWCSGTGWSPVATESRISIQLRVGASCDTTSAACGSARARPECPNDREGQEGEVRDREGCPGRQPVPERDPQQRERDAAEQEHDQRRAA